MAGLAAWVRHNFTSTISDYGERTFVDDVAESNWRRPAIGAGIGAVVGGAAGAAVGLHHLAGDQVTLTTQATAVTQPVVTGAEYHPAYMQPIYSGKTTTYIHHPARWSPEIQQEPTGQTYQLTTAQHSLAFGPLTGLAVGALGGALLGGLIGALIQVADRAIHGAVAAPPAPHPERGDRAPMIGLAVGAGIGAAAGAVLGSLDSSHAPAVATEQPVLVDRTIGFLPTVAQRNSIPSGAWDGRTVHYVDLQGAFGTPPFADGKAVIQPVPTGQIQTVTSHPSAEGLGPVSGALIGAGVGAGAGLLAGVAVGVLRKIADR